MKWHEGIKDYRGMHLCKSCWDGNHFGMELIRVYCAYHKTHPLEDEEAETCKKCRWKTGQQQVCHCLLGECECPCSKMGQNWADELHQRRLNKKQTKDAQTSIVAEMMQIGPKSQKDEG